MYLNALESQRIPDTDTLSLIYLPNQARSTVQSPAIEVTEQNQSPVEVTKSPSEANNSRQSGFGLATTGALDVPQPIELQMKTELEDVFQLRFFSETSKLTIACCQHLFIIQCYGKPTIDALENFCLCHSIARCL